MTEKERAGERISYFVVRYVLVYIVCVLRGVCLFFLSLPLVDLGRL